MPIQKLWPVQKSAPGMDQSIFILMAVGFYSILWNVLIANSADPDQTLCIAASDLGLHCLAMSIKKYTWLIRNLPLLI